MAKQCWSQTELGSWGHSVLQTSALVSFFSNNIFVTVFSAPMRAKVFKFYIHLHGVDVYCVKEKHDAEIYFALFFYLLSFFHLSIQCNA